MKECSKAWAFNKAKIWATAMNRIEFVVEYIPGMYDSISFPIAEVHRVVGKVTPKSSVVNEQPSQ